MTAAIFQNDEEPAGTTGVAAPSLAEIAAEERQPWPVREANRVLQDLVIEIDSETHPRDLHYQLARAEMALRMLLGYIGELR